MFARSPRSVRTSRCGIIERLLGSMKGSVYRKNFAETLPLLTVETHELHLLDRHMVIGRRIDLDAGQEHWQFEVPDRIGLLFNVLRAQIVSCSLEHVFKGHCEIAA